ncbi:MAG: flagellar hook-associated protein FlgL [Deltaproteobacteria bacterium]|nr:flagellar hook-associated protein FlgL [Deltaproteobacteria bacterium]
MTNKLMADNVTSNLFKKTEQLFKSQNMLSSGKRINKPSDDPVGIGQVLDYRNTISSIDQYTRNISHGESQLNLTDSTLGDVENSILRAKDLALSQATATASQESRKITAEEVKTIYDQVLQLANTKLGNNYIFAGHKTDTAPFSRDGNYDATYNGHSGDIKIIIGENLDISINANGDDVFSSGVKIFDVLMDLKNGLENNDTAAISAQIELFDNALDQVLTARAETGSKLNRLETTKNYWADFKVNVEQMLSDTENADIIKVITDLQSQENAYQASLSSAARIIQPSLMDFLR